MQTVTVDLGTRSYPIYIGPGLLENKALISPFLGQGRVLVVTNDALAPLYLEQVRALTGGGDAMILPDGEKHKTLQTVSSIYDRLLADKYDRNTTLVALGGGVIGDITGFAAATFLRGVNFIQIPTTLLAQVDSSVGGKTGVNHPLGKNMIGAFYQPRCVIADTDVLQSLPERELKAGLAEVIKYALINRPEFLDWLELNRPRILARDATLLSEAIRVSCVEKAGIVAKDEHEGGIRAWLNLGHTFGHAIETAMGYGKWLHGEAVAAGMVMASDLSLRMGWLPAAEAARIKKILQDYGMPVAPPADIEEQQYLDIMLSDKKARAGKINFVLLQGVGRAVVTSGVDSALLSQTLRAQASLCEP
ncbi:MAG: 3-dehydroquinate synthase [Gammaproteobacteria bacterium]|jgi:3-dehydroquinate synthase